MKIFGPRLIIEVDQAEEIKQTDSGIFVPVNVSNQKPDRGVVVYVGDVKDVSVGDTIVFEAFSAQDITIQDKKYIVVKEEHLIALL